LAGYALFGTYAAFGFAAVIVNLFTPLPTAFVGMRYGSAAGGMTVALTLLFVILSGGPTQGVMYLIQFGIPGAVLPWLLNRGMGWDKAVVMVLLVMAAASLGGLLIFSGAAGESPLAMVGGLIDKEIAQTSTVMQEMFAGTDLPADQKKEVARAVENMAAFLQKAYPGIMVTVAGLMTLGLVLLLALLARGRYVLPGKSFP